MFIQAILFSAKEFVEKKDNMKKIINIAKSNYDITSIVIDEINKNIKEYLIK